MNAYFETLDFPVLEGEQEDEALRGRGASPPPVCRQRKTIGSRFLTGHPGGPPLDPAIAAQLRTPVAGAMASYVYIGTLDQMDRLLYSAPGQGPYCGLYIIQFPPGSPSRAYSGESGNLRQRLMQHRRCGNAFGLDLARYPVFIWVAPHLTPDERRACEKELHVRARPSGVLSNILNELPVAFTASQFL
ncbi:hypothetical protein [Pseudoduganella umbonata]|uniref:GIY-YIG nuclease family protein n=1 Tax=Pseudoduganella umbonata TaxID=864828 RepID=A0A4P8HNL7_9BURK|nr:hypothetical protein [Pseudoduganella umbonata]MBB3220036.1 hypothetical protein [Pseudoduganella umbonata]QCP10042.1 hypothetical protein FCL38_06095 [Pseudoduganella umbonata]